MNRDGHWSEWSAWSTCSAAGCGTGLRTRRRRCDSPSPLNGGQECPGCNEQSELCSGVDNCPEVRKLSPWTPWLSVSGSNSGNLISASPEFPFFTILFFDRRCDEGAAVPFHVQSSGVRSESGENDAVEGGGAHLLQELVLKTQSFGRTRRAVGLLERVVALLGVLRPRHKDEEQVVRQRLLRRTLHHGGELRGLHQLPS